LIEFWAVATRPTEANGFGWEIQRAQKEIADFRQRFPFLPDTAQVFDSWLRIVLSSSVSGKRVHDARLAAVALAHSLDGILTFNAADFRSFHAIHTVDPRNLIGSPKSETQPCPNSNRSRSLQSTSPERPKRQPSSRPREGKIPLGFSGSKTEQLRQCRQTGLQVR